MKFRIEHTGYVIWNRGVAAFNSYTKKYTGHKSLSVYTLLT